MYYLVERKEDNKFTFVKIGKLVNIFENISEVKENLVDLQPGCHTFFDEFIHSNTVIFSWDKYAFGYLPNENILAKHVITEEQWVRIKNHVFANLKLILHDDEHIYNPTDLLDLILKQKIKVINLLIHLNKEYLLLQAFTHWLNLKVELVGDKGVYLNIFYLINKFVGDTDINKNKLKNTLLYYFKTKGMTPYNIKIKE